MLSVMENIVEIGITEKNELFIRPAETAFTLIYREAAGINWDKDLKALVGEPKRDMSFTFWFLHILLTVKNLGFNLQITDDTRWKCITEEDKNSILEAFNEQRT